MYRESEQEFVTNGAKKVTEADLNKVIDKSDEIKRKFESRGPLHRFIEDGKLLLSIVKDFRSGQYRKVPYGIIAAAAFALLYVFNPFDFMPDFIPFIGVLDDATVVGACLVAIERDLQKYKDWKQNQILE